MNAHAAVAATPGQLAPKPKLKGRLNLVDTSDLTDEQK